VYGTVVATRVDSEYFTNADFWDIHSKNGVRFSAGALRPVYESVLAVNGVTNPDGSQLFLPASPIPPGANNPFE
jgi:hypothetical protein